MLSNSNKVAGVCLSIALAVGGLIGFAEYQRAVRSRIYLQNENYGLQTAMFHLYNTKQADIVMLGDSHTATAHWDELLVGNHVLNRGISADVTQGFIARLYEVYKLQPRWCIVQGGINDLKADFSVDEIQQNFSSIIDSLLAHQIRVVLQSTFAVGTNHPNAVSLNTKVLELNSKLKFLCQKRSIPFLDITTALGVHEQLDQNLCYDGLHLNANGYRIWIDLIRTCLDSNK